MPTDRDVEYQIMKEAKRGKYRTLDAYFNNA